MAYLDDTGLAYFWGKIKAWAQGLFALIGHTHPSSDVASMSGYSMPQSSSAISASDTLNQAVGKLEKGVASLDSDAVHKAGTETITGDKTFKNALSQDQAKCGIILRNSSAVRGTYPSAPLYWSIPFLDADGAEWDYSDAGGHGRIAVLETTLFHPGALSHNQLAMRVYNNVAGSSDSVVLAVGYSDAGVAYAQAPSTSASRSSGPDIVTRDWVAPGGGGGVVHTSEDETITGTKTFSGQSSLQRLASLDRNSTLSSTAVVYSLIQNGSASLASHGLLHVFFERNPSGSVFGSTRYVNRSALRVYGATGKIADLSVSMDDSNNVRVHVPVSSGCYFHGYVGKNIIDVAADAVADSSLALRGDDPAKKRCGVVRFGNYNGYNIAQLGASDESDSAPVGLVITNRNGAVTGTFYGHYNPSTTARFNLGAGDLRWANLYISASAVSTSDEREKTSVSAVPGAVLDAWAGVDFVQFKMKASVAEKGAVRARLHSGLVAQRVAEAFSSRGLDASAYGLFCYDEWDAEPEVLAQNGEQVRPGREAGDLYSLRYEEALCMEAAYMRRENARLKKRVADLEERLAALELKVS